MNERERYAHDYSKSWTRFVGGWEFSWFWIGKAIAGQPMKRVATRMPRTVGHRCGSCDRFGHHATTCAFEREQMRQARRRSA